MENRIDKLFRTKLRAPSGELPDDAAMHHASRMIAEKGNRRRKFIVWFTPPVLVAAVAFFVYQFGGYEKEQTVASTTSEQSTTENNSTTQVEESHHALAETKNENKDVGNSSTVMNVVEHENTQTASSPQNQNPIGSSNSTTWQKPSAPAKNSNGKNRIDSPDVFNKVPVADLQFSEKVMNETMEGSADKHEEDGLVLFETKPEQVSDTKASDENSSTDSHPTNDAGIIAGDAQPEQDTTGSATEEHSASETETEPAVEYVMVEYSSAITSPQGPEKNSWLDGIELGTSFAQFNSQIAASDATLTAYSMRRNAEELNRNSFGADVLLFKNFNRWTIQSGLNYTCVGENVQYKPLEYFRPDIVDNSYYMLADSSYWTLIDNGYWDVFDTSMNVSGYNYEWAEFLQDSIWQYNNEIIEYTDSIYIPDITEEWIEEGDTLEYTEQFDSVLVAAYDSSLMAHNGFTCIKTFSIPLYVSYSFFSESSKWNVALKAGAEFSYAFARNAHYLSRNQQQLIALNDDVTYRKFGVSGYTGLNINRKLGSGYYIFAEPAIRVGLSSWNKNFSHKYNAHMLRAGVGLKF